MPSANIRLSAWWKKTVMPLLPFRQRLARGLKIPMSAVSQVMADRNQRDPPITRLNLCHAALPPPAPRPHGKGPEDILRAFPAT